MKALALVVPRSSGESVRRALADVGALRTDLEILVEGDRIAFPLAPGVPVPSDSGALEEREFSVRSAAPSLEFRDLLGWPPAEKALVPRSFDVVGDIVLIRLPPELEPRRQEVGEALLAFVPGSRLVGVDRGVDGVERLRRVERIAGGGPWTTRHRENQLELEVDVERAYFSPRLAREHARVAAEVRPGERVYDLCSGVGPFALTIAREGRARSVVAVDVNPVAIELLQRTAARYRLGVTIRAVVENVEVFARTAEPVERVVMNLPREGIKYGPLVAALVAPGGVLHYYEVVPRDGIVERRTMIERALSAVAPFEVEPLVTVHPYSPSSDLVAVTARRGGR